MQKKLIHFLLPLQFLHRKRSRLNRFDFSFMDEICSFPSPRLLDATNFKPTLDVNRMLMPSPGCSTVMNAPAPASYQRSHTIMERPANRATQVQSMTSPSAGSKPPFPGIQSNHDLFFSTRIPSAGNRLSPLPVLFDLENPLLFTVSYILICVIYIHCRSMSYNILICAISVH
jgi:hypothetical protein